MDMKLVGDRREGSRTKLLSNILVLWYSLGTNGLAHTQEDASVSEACTASSEISQGV